MGRNKLVQGGWMSDRRYWQLRTLNLVVGGVLLVMPVLRTAIAICASLTSWQFDPAKSQLEITLTEETTPRYFLLAEPPRIVVDLPNTQLGQVATQQTYTGIVRQVRVSQFQDGITRIVLELSPEVVLSSEQVKLERIEATPAGNRWALRPLIVPATTTLPVSPTTLPSTVPATPQRRGVNVPPLNRPEATTPATLPPARFPEPMPAVRVPTLQPSPSPTPSPLAPPQTQNSSPTLPIIEFGQPLPK